MLISTAKVDVRGGGRIFSSVMGTDCSHGKSSTPLLLQWHHPIIGRLLCLVWQRFHYLTGLLYPKQRNNLTGDVVGYLLGIVLGGVQLGVFTNCFS